MTRLAQVLNLFNYSKNCYGGVVAHPIAGLAAGS